MKNKYARLLLFFTGGIFFFLSSCSGSPPKIHDVTCQRIYTVKSGKIHARFLALFTDVSDEDGPKDIDSLYIIQDKDELFWKYDSSSWSEKKIGTERWIGSNRIQMPDNTEFPPGTYRVVVIDSGGDRDTRDIFLSKPVHPRTFPGISLSENGQCTIVSSYKENYLFLKNEKGDVVKTMKVITGTIPAELVLKGIKEKIRTFELYTVDTTSNTGYIISVDNKYPF